jgi:endonuclease/exonuclease/phosphatase family metal-dependent hydrolase
MPAKASFFTKAFSVIINLITWICCLSGALSLMAPYTDPIQHAYIQQFGLLFPVFFILYLILFLIHIFLRKWTALLPFVMIILSWNLLGAFIPVNKPSNETGTLKILTYNLHLFYGQQTKKNDIAISDQIASLLLASNAQLICLQEFKSWSANADQDIKEFVANSGFDHYYYESYWKGMVKKKEGMLILSHYPLYEMKPVRLDNGRLLALIAELSLPSGERVRVVNTHLISFGLAKKEIDFVGEASFTDRELVKTHGKTLFGKLNSSFLKRSGETKKLIETISDSDTKTIVCGDFNDTPSSFTYQQMMSAGFIDSHRASGNGFISTYAGRLPFLRIDYIFVSQDIKTHNAKKLPVVLSDHYPYQCEISLEAARL